MVICSDLREISFFGRSLKAAESRLFELQIAFKNSMKILDTTGRNSSYLEKMK